MLRKFENCELAFLQDMKKKQAAASLGSKTTSQPSGTSFSDNQVIMKKLKIFRGHILLF